MKILTVNLTSVLVLVGLTVSHAQEADIPPPATRIALVSKVLLAMESRGKAFSLPEDFVNPFVGRVREEVVPEVQNLPIPVGLSGPELLSQLSDKVPSTGTVMFGGNAMLLMGSKRVKIGEKIVVNLEGKVYELTLVAVTSTSFTVKLGDEVSTRSVRKR